MVRQAHTYLVGAMGGATLIAIAVVFFVVLVSAQVFKDWPIAALSSGSDASGVSAAHATSGPRAAAPASGSVVRPGSGASSNQHARHAGSAAGSNGSVASNDDLASAGGGLTETGAGSEEPAGSGGSGSGGGSETPGSNQSPSASNPATGAGSGRGGSGGSSGSGSTSKPVTSTVEKVTETVNKVDETALGGTLGNSGVTEVTEGVVNGAVGPESTVGHAVDETVGAVGGLLHGDH